MWSHSPISLSPSRRCDQVTNNASAGEGFHFLFVIINAATDKICEAMRMNLDYVDAMTMVCGVRAYRRLDKQRFLHTPACTENIGAYA